MNNFQTDETLLDEFTHKLLDDLFSETGKHFTADSHQKDELNALVEKCRKEKRTVPIIDLFSRLYHFKKTSGQSPDTLGITRQTLAELALSHSRIDEHGVTVGGRLTKALPIVEEAKMRVAEYLKKHPVEAPSGIELWDQIYENIQRIKKILTISDEKWNSYSGQIGNCIDSVEKFGKILDLPSHVLEDILRVTQKYRMRLTPYYAALIQRSNFNDPVLIQSVPTGEMADNVGIEIPPVAADHSPARLIDQFYPRVVTIKATNMCAMYCTHCLRIAHIGKKDRIYSDQAYEEALDYIRTNPLIRDVLITGGDAFVLPDKMLKKLLGALDEIDHVKMKRLGTRIPVTAPQRIENELLDILEESNDRKPVRVVTQINTAQEITPVSREAFKQLSKRVTGVLNQAVLLRGINDSRVKMWKLCETIHESYVRPYYVFNCSYRNPQFSHLRVPVERGRDIIESMYGNISGDAIPRYIATAGGKIPLHRSNVIRHIGNTVILKKPWNNQQVEYPDADAEAYAKTDFSFAKYKQ
ncbi:MAG: KamA family radical SAM protein [Desulfobacterales bacterium]